jgi:hypothetical protein
LLLFANGKQKRISGGIMASTITDVPMSADEREAEFAALVRRQL